MKRVINTIICDIAVVAVASELIVDNRERFPVGGINIPVTDTVLQISLLDIGKIVPDIRISR